jgi:mRNA interferase RelE/StbE
MGRVISKKFKLHYSETSINLIKKLHPQLKSIIKTKIEQIRENPFLGKHLQNELSGYLSFRAKRFRIIYKIDNDKNAVQIHYAGHRKDVYELLGEQLRKRK